jgi:regulator of sirC expression with transglutaminase-like and TPR domain
VGVDFRAYAAQPDEELSLLDGALLIAKDARPGLDANVVTSEIEKLAEPLARLELGSQPAAVQARALSDQLFVHEGFRGNTSNYYDPKNSFIDEVLTRRTGIPISLSVLYIEVARRVGVMASPVGFPGHFLVCVDDEEQRLLVDPFNAGRLLDESSLRAMLKRSGANVDYHADLITPTPVRQVVTRMLMNLRGIYVSRADHARLLVIFDRLIDLLPNPIEHIRDRGLLFGRLGAPAAALNDLQRYLELAPAASDAAVVRGWISHFDAATKRGKPSA